MFNKWAVIVVFLVVNSLSSAVFGADQRGEIQSLFPNSADLVVTIDRVDKNGIVAEDRFFSFAENMTVKAMSGYYENLNGLAGGEQVGLVLAPDTNIIKILCRLK